MWRQFRQQPRNCHAGSGPNSLVVARSRVHAALGRTLPQQPRNLRAAKPRSTAQSSVVISRIHATLGWQIQQQPHHMHMAAQGSHALGVPAFGGGADRISGDINTRQLREQGVTIAVATHHTKLQ